MHVHSKPITNLPIKEKMGGLEMSRAKLDFA